MTTTERAVLLVLLAITVAALWPMRREITDVTVTHVALLDDHGVEEVPLPAGWSADEVWVTLAEIEALPEIVHA